MSTLKPTIGPERLEVLDALRGFALFGILLANLYSFIGYNTYTPQEIISLPILDKAVLFFIDWFVEGKFYGTFSILFGVGFVLQAERFQKSDSNFTAFWFRRMVVLFCIGIIHMYCIWNGDILTLYSLLGMLLPLFLRASDKTIFRWIIILLILPVLIYYLQYLTPEAPFWGTVRSWAMSLKTQWGFGDLSLLEMRTSKTPIEVFSVNIVYAIPRFMSYLMTGRYFHVLGLFLIGILVARHWLPKIREHEISVPKITIWLGVIGLIFSLAYAVTKLIMGAGFALSEMGVLQVIVYNVGSTSLALAIAMLFVHIWATGRAKSIFKNLSILGRMALSNYIFQNATAIIIFFGYGFGLMRKVPFSSLPLFAFGILLVQWAFSRLWLKRYKQGPLEYLWKKLSYGSSK